MTNFEKYKDEILNFIDDCKFFDCSVAVDLTTGKPEKCCKIDCNKCLFRNSNCNQELIKWLYEEYKPTAKPCPFCGKAESIRLKYSGTQCQILCDIHKGGCGSSSGYYNSEIEAIDKWNQRV